MRMRSPTAAGRERPVTDPGRSHGAAPQSRGASRLGARDREGDSRGRPASATSPRVSQSRYVSKNRRCPKARRAAGKRARSVAPRPADSCSAAGPSGDAIGTRRAGTPPPDFRRAAGQPNVKNQTGSGNRGLSTSQHYDPQTPKPHGRIFTHSILPAAPLG